MRLQLVLLLASLVASQAWAGTIAIQLTHRAELQEGELRAALTISNGGDEAARGVTPVLRFRDAESRAPTQESLPPGEPFEAPLAVPAGELGEGRWPYAILVDYADANLYPFQAVSVGMLEVGSPPLPKVSLTAPAPATLADEARLAVKLKNLSESPQEVRLAVVGPEAIETTAPAEAAVLTGWEEREVPLRLVNRAALPGSVYPLFVTAEWQDGEVHQAVVVQASVEILAGDTSTGGPGPGLWIVGAVLVLGAGFLLLRLRGR
jgi:hypothetical protein